MIDRLEGTGRHDVTNTLPLGVEGAATIEGSGALPVAPTTARCAERLFVPRVIQARVAQGSLRVPAELGWTVALPGHDHR